MIIDRSTAVTVITCAPIRNAEGPRILFVTREGMVFIVDPLTL